MAYAYEMGPIRPPSEAQSLLIRVTRNCPWNKCEFCHTYKGEKFSFRPVEEIEQEIDTIREMADEIRQISWTCGFAGTVSQEVVRMIFNHPGRYGQAFQSVAAWLYFGGTQAFLQDANSLMTKTADLLRILRHLKEKLPSIQRVTSYARARTAAKKSLAELKELGQAGLSRIHIGMETAYDPLLQYMKKGTTSEEQIQGGRKIVESGISLSEYVMPGLGGRRWSREHALETAGALNQIDPHFIRLRTLYVRRDMPLHAKVASGEFSRPLDDEIVAEIRLFIEALEGIRSRVVSDHVLNLLEEVEGQLPEGKNRMIEVIDRYQALSPEDRLDYRVGRRLGYYRNLRDLQDPDLRRQVSRIIDQARGGGGTEGAQPPGDVEKAIYEFMENYI